MKHDINRERLKIQTEKKWTYCRRVLNCGKVFLYDFDERSTIVRYLGVS